MLRMCVGHPLTSLQESTSACRGSCLASEDCNAWLYCWRLGGCDDGQDMIAHLFPFQVPAASDSTVMHVGSNCASATPSQCKILAVTVDAGPCSSCQSSLRCAK